MKISGLVYNNGNYFSDYKRNNSIRISNPYLSGISDSYNFTGLKPTGVLSKASSDTVVEIGDSLIEIKKFLSRFDNKKVIDIKKQYKGLITKKGPGHTFKISQYDEELTLLTKENKRNILRFTLSGKYKNDFFVIGNGDILDSSGISIKDIEEYIQIAKTEVDKFKKFLKQKFHINPSEKLVETKYEPLQVKRKSEIKNNNDVTTNFNTGVPAKDSVQRLLDVFAIGAEKLPSNITAILSPKTQQILGLTTKTPDGVTLSVIKGINTLYGKDLTYLMFRKTMPDGVKSLLAVDLNQYKFLKLNENNKPLVRGNYLYEYSPEEVKKRGFVERLNEYIDILTKDVEIGKVQDKADNISVAEQKYAEGKITPPENKNVNITSNEGEILTQVSDPENPKKVSPMSKRKKSDSDEFSKIVKNSANMEEIIPRIKEKAQADAKLAAEAYFNEFITAFQTNLTTKLTDFQSKIAGLFKL